MAICTPSVPWTQRKVRRRPRKVWALCPCSVAWRRTHRRKRLTLLTRLTRCGPSTLGRCGSRRGRGGCRPWGRRSRRRPGGGHRLGTRGGCGVVLVHEALPLGVGRATGGRLDAHFDSSGAACLAVMAACLRAASTYFGVSPTRRRPARAGGCRRGASWQGAFAMHAACSWSCSASSRVLVRALAACGRRRRYGC